MKKKNAKSYVILAVALILLIGILFIAGYYITGNIISPTSPYSTTSPCPPPSPTIAPSMWCECEYLYAKDGGRGGDSFTLNYIKFPVPISGNCEEYNQQTYTSLTPPKEFPKARITNCRKIGRF